MNLLVSYNSLREYLKIDKPVKDFAREFSLKSQTIDRFERLQPKFKNVVTAKILEIKPHPNADKLKLAKVDFGRGKPTVVCGAPNIKVGQIVPLALLGAKVCDPAGEDKFVTIKKAKIRDVESNGMLCSQKELGLGQDHSGIMVLPPKTKIGQKLEDVLELDDYILDIEVTSNRPDAMSIVGLAREAGAVFGVKPNIKVPGPNLEITEETPLSVEVKDSKLCPRYNAVVMTDVKIAPSPMWLQMRLIAAGMRPINNLVDITNYVLLEYGQPMHVFDYKKLKEQKIVVRTAKAGEKVLALDGNSYKLKPDNLVIADGKDPIAVAGVMGGEKSAVQESTKTIVFESANFDPVAVRKTSRALKLYSQSSNLFEKGLRPEATFLAILRAIDLTQKFCGGKAASPIIDIYGKAYRPTKIKFDITSVGRHLGVEIPAEQIKKILESLGFGISGSTNLDVGVPWWRVGDILAEPDLIEEIARIYGYHNLPTELPEGKIPPNDKDKTFYWEGEIKKVLAGYGFSEVYNYSFVSKDLLARAKFSAAYALKINNPLNEEMEYMRTTLLPQILQNVEDNINNFPKHKIFELNNIYLPQKNNQLPEERLWLTGAVAGEGQDGFLLAKGVIEALLKKLGIKDCQFPLTDPKCPLWEKALGIDIYKGKIFLGQFGLVKKNILDSFGIEKETAVFDLDFENIVKFAKTEKVFEPIPEFPSVVRDLAIVIDWKLSWAEVSRLATKSDKLIAGIDYLSTFTDQSLGGGKKSLAFRLTFRLSDRTLKSEEVDAAVERLSKKLEKEFGAVIR
ncbi:phenylalanine--tRNA ligase subunit beta [Candidatus Falkowbacteria bacterium]|nr:phenylalanine--tRNA ligase subunit beta [Candidatus Falkowbacteria bacterium]